jgi:hypothetical protein
MLDLFDNWSSWYHQKNKTWTRLSQVVKYPLAMQCGGGAEAQPIKLAINIHNLWDNASLLLQCMCIHFMK